MSSPPASLGVVEAVVQREYDAQERRAEAADARAGLLLGLAGLVAALGGRHGWLAFDLSTRFFAALAGFTALTALSMPVIPRLDVGTLDDRLQDDPDVLRGLLAMTRVDLYRVAEAVLAKKLARVRLASRLATAALAFAVLGATFGGGR
jgi:hypothetical protein